MVKTELWMQRALRRKPGALHRQLGIPKDKKIPVSLMQRVQVADTGDLIKNPTKVGKPRYRVTTLLQRRVNPVLTARNFKRKRRARLVQ